MTAAESAVEGMHGRCTFCQAPLCFGPYECCALFGQHTSGALVVSGQRLAGLEVCRHPQCSLLARTSERLTLDRLVAQVTAQLLAVDIPFLRLPEIGHFDRAREEWAETRARNIIAGLQPDLKTTPITQRTVEVMLTEEEQKIKPVGHGWSCRCRDCGAVDDMTARRL